MQIQRNELAASVLVSTAFLIAALICLQAGSRMQNRAEAEMVVHKDSVTMITTQFQGDSEILYVLHSRTGRLLAYIHNTNRRTIDLLPNGGLNIEREFGAAFRDVRAGQQEERTKRRDR